MSEETIFHNKLAMIRERYALILEESIAERERLEIKIHNIQNRLDVVNDLLTESASADGSKGQAQGTDSLPHIGKYAGAKLSVAVLGVLKEAKGEPLTPNEILSRMTVEGFQSDSKNITIMVRNTCKRFIESGKAKVGPGKRVTFYIPQTPIA